MKVVNFLVFAIVLMLGSNVSAEKVGTSGARWDTPYAPLTAWLNTNDIEHNHDSYYYDTDTWRPATFVPKRRNPVGLGWDLLLWDNSDLSFENQYRYDFQNDEHINYVVGRNKTSLWEMWKNFWN